jgi:hypothetical protein
MFPTLVAGGLSVLLAAADQAATDNLATTQMPAPVAVVAVTDMHRDAVASEQLDPERRWTNLPQPAQAAAL